MNDSQATSSRSTGPIRPRLVKPSHPLPYARDVAATAEQGEPQQQHEEEGLLARVKSIVSWLVPGWLGSPQKCRPATTARHHSELAHADAASQTMLLDKERPGVGAMAMVEDRPLAEELLQRITSGKGSRAYLYEELAQFFKLKESLNVHLSQEEYERLAYVIQRQEMPRPRPPLATPLPKSHSTMMSSMASASTVSRRRTARRSPRRTPSLSSVCEPQPMTDEKLAVRPPGFARPAAVPRKARVYSARFDESDDLVVTAGVSGERKEREDDRMGLTKPVSESRKRLVEEARQRVAEQIRLAQLPPKPEDAAEVSIRVLEPLTALLGQSRPWSGTKGRGREKGIVSHSRGDKARLFLYDPITGFCCPREEKGRGECHLHRSSKANLRLWLGGKRGEQGEPQSGTIRAFRNTRLFPRSFRQQARGC